MGLWDIVVWIGVLRVVYMLGQYLYFNYYCHIDISKFKYGWIVITGASDGIGKSLATSLARRGLKLVLVARNQSKLEKVVREIVDATKNNSIEYVVADFTYSHRNPEQFYTELMQKLSKYEVSGLINNVGVLDFNYLDEQPLEEIEKMLGINIYPQTLLSYYFVQKFVERFNETKQRSLLINFSSTSDIISMPTTSVYSATKRYSDFLSEGIRFEYNNAVDVATVKPGVVETNMTNNEMGNGFSKLPLTAEVNSYAESVIRNLHKGIMYGHWKHDVLVFTMTMFPHEITSWIIKLSFPLLIKLGLAH